MLEKSFGFTVGRIGLDGARASVKFGHTHAFTCDDNHSMPNNVGTFINREVKDTEESSFNILTPAGPTIIHRRLAEFLFELINMSDEQCIHVGHDVSKKTVEKLAPRIRIVVIVLNEGKVPINLVAKERHKRKAVDGAC